MTTQTEYMRAVDLLLAADPDTLHGAIAVLLATARQREPMAMVYVYEAMRMMRIIHESRSCAH